MRPVTDRHKVSRAKLSYIIDATAAPVCIIAPISSWAAAVTSSVPADSGINGFAVFYPDHSIQSVCNSDVSNAAYNYCFACGFWTDEAS